LSVRTARTRRTALLRNVHRSSEKIALDRFLNQFSSSNSPVD
jgi:hypothetical protein